MPRKISSAPLLGSPTPKEVEAIQKHMQAVTTKVIKNADQARKLLEDIAAIAPKAEDGVKPAA